MIAPSEPDAVAPAATAADRQGHLKALLLLVIAQLLAGVVIGLIWLRWSPRSVSYFLSDGSGGSLVIPGEGESQVAGDGRFVVLSALAGLAFGLLTWRLLRRWRGPVTIAVLAAGSFVGSLLALGVGELLASGTDTPKLNTAFHPKLTLHAWSALWLQALIAVLAYTALVGLSSDPWLGRAPAEPSEPTSDNTAAVKGQSA